MSVSRDEAVLKKNAIGDKPYILAVSTMTRNKNFQAIVQAVEQIKHTDFEVVIVGGKDSRVYTKAQTLLPDFVKYVGYVSDGELRVLYEQALCFVYPSLYEGFGLPPLEAMACGSPVIVSDIPVHQEILKEAAIYITPGKRETWREALEKLENKTIISQKKKSAQEIIKQYSWERSCDTLVNALLRVEPELARFRKKKVNI